MMIGLYKNKIREILPLITRSAYLGSVVIMLILLTISVVEYTVAFEVFNFDNMKVVGNETVSSEELFRLSGLKFGENLFDIDIQRAAERIEANPFIKRVQISRDLPNSVAMRVFERKPFVFIAQGSFYTADESGHLLPSRSHKNFDLPIITGIDDLSLPFIGEERVILVSEKSPSRTPLRSYIMPRRVSRVFRRVFQLLRDCSFGR